MESYAEICSANANAANRVAGKKKSKMPVVIIARRDCIITPVNR